MLVRFKYLLLSTSLKDEYVRNNPELKYKDKVSFEEFCYYIIDDIKLILNCLNVPPHRKGYLYWRDALIIFLTSGKESINICKDIYLTIATKNNVSYMSVERAMRTSFEDAFYRLKNKEVRVISKAFIEQLIGQKNSELLVRIAGYMVSKEFQKNKQRFYEIY